MSGVLSSVTAVLQPDVEPERHLALNDIPDPVIDQCVRIAKQHVVDSLDIKSMKEREIDAFLDDGSDVSGIDSEEEILDEQTNASEAVSAEVSVPTAPIPITHVSNSSGPINADDGNPNSINDDSDSSDSEEEMSDDSDDDGYNGYGGYNEYGECDRGYYYCDGRYERKTSPMMSPIISPVTA
ncbi:hypothetical protein RhiirA4_462060 [Rhizophagus irregularis]|uniref:Uncharacterized protein n=1 Tax=Rhizophagus irregularis TaxID=588596 RepID=A0A2I1GK72_9GLOM|nr:hypothetical protein RhiirA4_462060 [Rhizophagus irregularis]